MMGFCDGLYSIPTPLQKKSHQGRAHPACWWVAHQLLLEAGREYVTGRRLIVSLSSRPSSYPVNAGGGSVESITC